MYRQTDDIANAIERAVGVPGTPGDRMLDTSSHLQMLKHLQDLQERINRIFETYLDCEGPYQDNIPMKDSNSDADGTHEFDDGTFQKRIEEMQTHIDFMTKN